MEKEIVKKYMRTTFNLKFEILEVENVTKTVTMGIVSYNVSMKVRWRDNKYVRKHFHYVFTPFGERSSYVKSFGAEFYEVERISDKSFIREMRLNELGI